MSAAYDKYDQPILEILRNVSYSNLIVACDALLHKLLKDELEEGNELSSTKANF